MELNKIYNSDNVEGLKKLPPTCIDLVVTSPPYDGLRKYNGFSYDVDALIGELKRTVKDNGVIVWITSDQTIQGGETLTSFHTVDKFVASGFKLYDTMIWLKPSPQAPTEGRYYDVFEYMFIICKGNKPKTINFITDKRNISFGKKHPKETRSNKEDRKIKEGSRCVAEFSRRNNVWECSRGVSLTSHPAVFPEKLVKDHIYSWSNLGDVVCDPFLGSGTTALVARDMNRNYLGYEISFEYYNIAKNRLRLEQLSLF